MKITNSKIQTFLAVLAIIVAIITPEIRSKILGTGGESTLHENEKSVANQPHAFYKEFNQELGKSSRVKEQEISRTQPGNLPLQPVNSEDKPKEENYTSFINTSLNKSDVSVLILDANDNILPAVSSTIAKVYGKSGKTASIGFSYSRKDKIRRNKR